MVCGGRYILAWRHRGTAHAFSKLFPATKVSRNIGFFISYFQIGARSGGGFCLARGDRDGRGRGGGGVAGTGHGTGGGLDGGGAGGWGVWWNVSGVGELVCGGA